MALQERSRPTLADRAEERTIAPLAGNENGPP